MAWRKRIINDEEISKPASNERLMKISAMIIGNLMKRNGGVMAAYQYLMANINYTMWKRRKRIGLQWRIIKYVCDNGEEIISNEWPVMASNGVINGVMYLCENDDVMTWNMT